MTEEKKKFKHLMVFRCARCKAEHRPKPCWPGQDHWTKASIELWSLGWKLQQTQSPASGFFGSGYSLHCPDCAPSQGQPMPEPQPGNPPAGI